MIGLSLPRPLAVVFGQAVAQNAFFVDVTGDIEAVLYAGQEIFGTMRGRGVDYARTGVHGDVVGEHAQNFAIEKWVLEIQALELASGEASELMRIDRAYISCAKVFAKLRGNDITSPKIPERRTLHQDETPRP